MRRIALTLLTAAVLASCSKPGYLLHSKSPSSDEENATASRYENITLTYDRGPWAVYEKQLSDGSIWVHYPVVLTNSGESAASFRPEGVHLLAAGNRKVPAEFEKGAAGGSSIQAGSILRRQARFRIPADAINHHRSSEEPLQLVVPLEGNRELKLKLWLWEE